EAHFAGTAAKGEAKYPGLGERVFAIARDLQIKAGAVGIHARCLYFCDLQGRQSADQMRHVCTATLPTRLPTSRRAFTHVLERASADVNTHQTLEIRLFFRGLGDGGEQRRTSLWRREWDSN